MNGDPSRSRMLAAQGLAAIAYFFFAHGAHGATTPQVKPVPAHSPAAAVQPRAT